MKKETDILEQAEKDGIHAQMEGQPLYRSMDSHPLQQNRSRVQVHKGQICRFSGGVLWSLLNCFYVIRFLYFSGSGLHRVEYLWLEKAKYPTKSGLYNGDHYKKFQDRQFKVFFSSSEMTQRIQALTEFPLVVVRVLTGISNVSLHICKMAAPAVNSTLLKKSGLDEEQQHCSSFFSCCPVGALFLSSRLPLSPTGEDSVTCLCSCQQIDLAKPAFGFSTPQWEANSMTTKI